MSRIYILVGFIFLSITAKAQLYSSAFHAQLSVLTPLTDKSYVSKTSLAGARLGYTKFLNDRFGVGIEGGYSTLNDYTPRKTYYYAGGAFTSDFFNYLDYYTITANGQYFFSQGEKFIPYASLAMGVAFSNYRLYYNVYEDRDKRTGFVARPEVGFLFRMKEYSSWGLKSSLCYDYAITKSTKFDVGNLSGIAFQIGLVLFTD